MTIESDGDPTLDTAPHGDDPFSVVMRELGHRAARITHVVRYGDRSVEWTVDLASPKDYYAELAEPMPEGWRP